MSKSKTNQEIYEEKYPGRNLRDDMVESLKSSKEILAQEDKVIGQCLLVTGAMKQIPKGANNVDEISKYIQQGNYEFKVPSEEGIDSVTEKQVNYYLRHFGVPATHDLIDPNSPNRHLDIYGDPNDYKKFPDINEEVRPDGLLMSAEQPQGGRSSS